MAQTFRSQVTAQSSQAGTADTRVTAGTTVLNSESAGNADGAYEVLVELNVTSAPSTATYAKLYVEESNDGTNYATPKVVGVFLGIGTSAGRYSVRLHNVSPKMRLTWEPIGYNMTATMYARPSYPA